LGVVVGIAVFVQVRSTRALQAEIAALRTVQEVRNRGAKNLVRPEREAGSTGSAASSSNANQELASLRDEIVALRTEVKKIASAQSQLASAVDAVTLQIVPAADWKNAGRATPAATMETIYWAALSGELTSLAEALLIPDDDRAKVDEWFASLPESIRQNYGTAEKLIGLLVAKDAGPLTGMQVLAQDEINDTDVLLHVRFATDDGGIDSAEYLLRRTPEGWRLVVPADGVDWFARHLRPEN
jgi:hypothetical protein